MAPSIFLINAPHPALHPRAKVPKRPEDVDNLRSGDVVQSWDSWFVWDEFCESNDTRKRWRSASDPLADAVIESLLSEKACLSGIDLLEAVKQRAALSNDEDDAYRKFYKDVTSIPPKGIAATPHEIEKAQDFFAGHAIPMSMSLLYFSLAGGFASPRISRTLRSVSYLVPSHSCPAFSSASSKTNAVARLFETLQFVIDIMGGSLPPVSGSLVNEDRMYWHGVQCLQPGAGEGWKSCVRVRLLHAAARHRVKHRSQRPSDTPLFYDPATDGVPINQEDLAQTLSAFSFVPIHSLRKLGYPFSKEDANASIAFWRHVGWYLGVDPTILEKHFANWGRSEVFGATCGQALVLELQEGLASTEAALPEPPTVAILDAVGPTLYNSLEDQMAMSRYLIGDKLSDLLNLPQTSTWRLLSIRATIFLWALPVLLGEMYTLIVPERGRLWEKKRRALTLEGLGRMVRFKLGMRRTTFRPRAEDAEVDSEVLKSESVYRDVEGVKRFISAWGSLHLELMLNVGFGCIGAAGLLWVVCRAAPHFYASLATF